MSGFESGVQSRGLGSRGKSMGSMAALKPPFFYKPRFIVPLPFVSFMIGRVFARKVPRFHEAIVQIEELEEFCVITARNSTKLCL